jgi:hypothetical protein
MDTEMDTETDTETDMEMDMETDMETDTDMVKDTDMELEYFAKFPYGTIVAIAPYVLPVTHHGAISNSTINL